MLREQKFRLFSEMPKMIFSLIPFENYSLPHLILIDDEVIASLLI